MPLSSIEMDHVDFVASPREIGAELGRLGSLFALPQIRSLEEGEPSPTQEQSLQRVLQLLRNSTGLDLRQYKPETIRRRIARRMVVRRVNRLPNMRGYCKCAQMKSELFTKMCSLT